MAFTSRITYLLGFLFIGTLLGIAYYLQNHGITPCPLCILQRYMLIILGIVFLIGAALNLKKWGQISLGILAALFALAGGVLAARQVWLQHLPPNLNADCGTSLTYMLQVMPWNQVLQKVFAGGVECAQVDWRFLYLSLAEWSLIAFILLFLVCLRQIIKAAR